MKERFDTIVLKLNRSTITIDSDDIVFFESLGHYVNVHMNSKAVYHVRGSITELLKKLKEEQFVRVHRSIAVNLKYVKAIGNREVLFKGEWRSVPVSRTYRNVLTEMAASFKNK